MTRNSHSELEEETELWTESHKPAAAFCRYTLKLDDNFDDYYGELEREERDTRSWLAEQKLAVVSCRVQTTTYSR